MLVLILHDCVVVDGAVAVVFVVDHMSVSFERWLCLSLFF